MSRYKKIDFDIKNFFRTLAIVVVSVISSLVLYDMYIKIETTSDVSSNIGGNRVEYMEETIGKKNDIPQIIEEATEAVVGISKMKTVGSSIFLENSTSDLGIGSGVIISDNGYILTNWHVSGDKYSSCYVTLETGNTYNGTVVWADSDLDLSIVKINMTGLKYIHLGDSDDIKIGQNVYAIGNPIGFEFQRSVTGGIISGKNRTIKIEEDDKSSYMEDLIQTDATINPGNSGGPLIDEDGNMIGINTIKISSAEGIGFAVPVNLVKPIINNFLQTGQFDEAYIGIYGYDKEVIPYLDSDIEFDCGIYVAYIAPDGPCFNSGIKVGDIITKVDNYDVNKMTELKGYVYTKKPEDSISLKILRNNKEMSVNIKLGTKK